jgi:hypothetical protein
LFPNPRKGWHRRPLREYCRKVYEEYGDLDFETFTDLVKSFSGSPQSFIEGPEASGSVFAKRLITGLAAESYFEAVRETLGPFKDRVLENTTRFGCGYDFRLWPATRRSEFVAVEVKGLREPAGNISLTAREYDAANSLRQRFFLFVVRNFQEKPFHTIYADPLQGELLFRETKRTVVQITWNASV